MANETTSSSWTKVMLSESLSAPLKAHTADKMVVFGGFNEDNIDGEASLSRDYPVETDLGPASSGSEGTDVTANVEMTYGATVSPVPTEGALEKLTVTTRAMRRRLPGFSGGQIYEALRGQDLAMATSILAPDARRLTSMVREKIEDDCANLFASLTNTVGNTGVDLALADLINAMYTLRTLNPHHDNWRFDLWPNQLKELTFALAGASGSAAAAWFTKGDASFLNHHPDVAGNGFHGTFMNIPLYVPTHDLRTLVNTNADVAGALSCQGVGDPLTGQQGAFVYVEGEPYRFDLDYDASARECELIAVQEYAVALLDDNQGVGIITDAP